MYEKFYGLNAKPFSKTPDPKFLFMSKTHEEALARLQYAIDEKEITVLTGEIGCGKTTLTRALMDSLDERHRVIIILNPRLKSLELIKTVCARLECNMDSDYKNEMLDAIYEKLYQDYRSGKSPVLIIDEAHLIPYRETFEEIRLLTNFQMDDVNMLSIILAGQPELRGKLNTAALSALKQRIGLFYHLGAIEKNEIAHYISHRLRTAGRDGTLFSDAAIDSLYSYSQGVPRVINSLANMALLEGFARDAAIIDQGIVHAAAKEIGLNGYSKNTKEI